MKFNKHGVAIVHKPKTLHSLVMGIFNTRQSYTAEEIARLHRANLEGRR